jgi:hypothetical protein
MKKAACILSRHPIGLALTPVPIQTQTFLRRVTRGPLIPRHFLIMVTASAVGFGAAPSMRAADNLHPGDSGYKAMADWIDLRLLTEKR